MRGKKKPSSRDEFFSLTKEWYGVGLTFIGHVGNRSGSYEIDQLEDWYSELVIPKQREKELGQYEGLKPILLWTFGQLTCGGVAASHYGQYKFDGYRNQKRLKKLYQSTLSPYYQEIVHNYPNEAYRQGRQ